MFTFHVADSLTGQIVGRLYPRQWEIVEPLDAPGTGSLTVPLPAVTGDRAVDADRVALFRDLCQPRIRWVAIEDEQGRFLFAGPIPRRPGRSGDEIVIPLVDWRAWFYRAPLRPKPDGSRGDFSRTQSDQATILRDLARAALDAPGVPALVIDEPAPTGVLRDLSALQLDRPIGEHFDAIVQRERGGDWFTYASRASDPTKLVPHVAFAWPERSSRPAPILLAYTAQGGTVAAYSWPEGAEGSTRAYAVGSGEPPDQPWAVAESPELSQGFDVAWEEVIGPLDGVTRSATAFEYAYQAVSGGAQGVAEFTVPFERLHPCNYVVGDRARVRLEDGWEDVSVPSARIVERVVSGGPGQPGQQVLKVDLSAAPPDGQPGLAVTA